MNSAPLAEMCIRDSYDDWVAAERDRLRALLADALQRLAARLEADGRHAEALTAAHRLLRLDPLHEEATVRLMRLNALAGDRAGVRRAYESLASVLRLEVGVEPAADTTAAYHHWLSAAPVSYTHLDVYKRQPMNKNDAPQTAPSKRRDR